MESEAIKSPRKERPPILFFPIFLLGFLGIVAVWVSHFTSIHPLMEIGGWAGFLGANLILIFQAAFRKKYSNIVGEFHAMNAVSWFIAIVMFILMALFGFVVLFVWSQYKQTELSNDRMMVIGNYLVVAVATTIAYGWMKWFFKKRK